MVVVTWNAARDLPAFLESLAVQAIAGLELVVVDNASVDGSAEMVAELWPSARVICLDRNTGFAAAADRGIAESSAGAVALLNFDVVLQPGYLARCLEAFDDPAVGSVQGVLVRPGGTVLDSAGHIVSRGRWVRNRGENQPVDTGDPGGTAPTWAPARTFGVTAAAAVYRRAMLEQARAVSGHYLEGAFFAYLEDVDLDWRARWLGWETAVVDAVAVHVRSGTGARPAPALQRHIIKNRLLVLYRNEGLDTLWPDLPWVASQLLARWGFALLTAPSSLLGIVDFLRLWRGQRPVRLALRAGREVEPSAIREWLGRSDGGATGFGTRTQHSAGPAGDAASQAPR